MKQAKLGTDRIETQYVKFFGGIDSETPVLSLKPGNALEAMNYEPGLLGGYKRIDGFERLDGRPAPSSATYFYLEGELAALVAIGQTITGATSGATGLVIRLDTALGAISVTKVTGAFEAGEQVLVGGAPIGALSIAPSPRGYRDAYNDALALAAAADAYRADIGPVPGQGPVRGVWIHQGVRYAFRDALGGATCAMYKATSSGWAPVPLGEEIAFSNATINVVEGATIAVGFVSATIARIVLETGSLLSGTNTGRLILSGRTGGTFAAGAAVTTKPGTPAGNITLGGAPIPIALAPGGRFEFVSTNFAGSLSTYRMYGVNGMNRAFEFDGAVFVPIGTGAPKFIAAHKEKLWLAQDASVVYSGDGLPYQYTVTAGAGEVGMGDTVTGFAVQTGDTLAIFARSSSNQLNGATNNTFQMLPISNEIGALAYTVQNVGKTYGMDDRGIVATDRTQAYGNFIQSTISQSVQPLVDLLRTKVVGSSVYRARGQYRLYGTDGSGLIAAFNERGLVGITQFQYPVKPTCFACCEDATGKDVVLFGAEDGFVYQADSGSSFDGAPIEAYLRLPFNNISSPRLRKRFRKAVMEMSASSYAAIRFQPEFSYGDPDVGTHRLQSGEIAGSGGYWDASNWDAFYYDARLVSTPEFGIEGRGLNMAMLFYSSSAIDAGHVLQGVIIHFSLGRLSR
jgi:hypothetical protein